MFCDFPISSRAVTNQTLLCREKLNYFAAGRVWLVTSRLGSRKLLTFFYSVLPWRQVSKRHLKFLGSPKELSSDFGRQVADMDQFYIFQAL
jgi:hypothetical protein